MPHPSTTSERLHLLDALRGFALLGILLANVLVWSGWVMVDDAAKAAWAGEAAALWQYRLHHLLIDGKFYTLFSLLFGIGFAMQLERLSLQGDDGLRLYRRRVLVLLGIGLVHTWLVWDGDILLLYALLGLLLPLFRRWSTRNLVLAGVGLVFVVPVAGRALFQSLGWAPHAALYSASFAIGGALGADTSLDKVLPWMQREDFAGRLAWQASGPWFSWGLRLESWRIPKVLGIMLIGMAAGRGIAVGRLPADRRLLWQVLAAGLAIGLPASLAYAWTPRLGQDSWPSMVGTVPLALAYAAAFALAWPLAQRWLRVFAAPGRMALTNYLLQSVIGVTVFMGFGLGLAGRLPLPAIYAYAIGLYGLQVLFSRWWLARHAHGPMEALWRRWTYGRPSAVAGAYVAPRNAG